MRSILGAALGAGLAVALSAGVALAQPAAYPDRSVQVVVGWQAGGIIDTIARALSQSLSDLSGQRFVVINRDGAAGVVGAQAVATARPDGYTIGFGPITSITTAAHTVRGVPFTIDSFEFVCNVFNNVLTVAVAEDSPFRSMPELIAAIRARPDSMTYGHSGTHSLAHLAFLGVVQALELRIVDVPYRGEAPLYPELLAGRIAFGIGTIAGGRGKPVRILSVFGDDRSVSLPDVPSSRELGLPTQQPIRVGVTAPRGTPPEVLDRLGAFCGQATQAAPFREIMTRLREPIEYADRAAFTAQARRDNDDKVTLVRALGLIPR